MASKKPSSAAQPTGRDAEPLERLIDAVESVADQLQVLRQAIDEIREEFAWAVRNDHFRIPPNVVQVTSMPADPTAEDWEINRVKPEDLPPDDEAVPPPPPPAPTAPPPKRPAEKPSYDRGGKKRRPLSTRMYFQAHLTELVRLIGYHGLPAVEAREKLKPLIEQYGKEKMEAAVEEIVHIDESVTPPIARLTEQARKFASALLGPPPNPAATAPPSPVT